MLEERNEYLVFISNLTGIPSDDIMGRSRHYPIARARQLLAWALRTLRGYTFMSIGVMMGIDYATVINHSKKINYHYQSDLIKEWMRQIERYKLKGGVR